MGNTELIGPSFTHSPLLFKSWGVAFSWTLRFRSWCWQHWTLFATGLAPTSCKWSFNPDKWPYICLTGVLTSMCRVVTLLKTARGGGFSKNPYFEPYLQKSPILLTTTFQKGEIKILQIQWNQCNSFKQLFVSTLGKSSNLICAYFFQKSWKHQLMMNVWFEVFWGIPLFKGIGPSRGYPHESQTTGPLPRFRTTSDPARRMTIRQGLGLGKIGWNPGILSVLGALPPFPENSDGTFFKATIPNRKIVFPTRNFQGICRRGEFWGE